MEASSSSCALYKRANEYDSGSSCDKACPPGLESLNLTNLFIVQQNLCGGWFNASRSYEIRDDKKQLLFKGNQVRRYCSTVTDKIILSNLRRKEIILVEFDSSGLCGSSAEATISAPLNKPIGHIVKYGGVYAPPSFEITDSDNHVLFTAEPKETTTTGGLEYPIKTTNGLVAHVGVKSGLNFILNTATHLSPLEKALLIGFIIALDLLKHGKHSSKKNEYEYPGE